MKLCYYVAVVALSFFIFASPLFSEDAPSEKQVRKITPGKVIIPFERMRRIWGELISMDLETRTGTFRAEGDDKVFHFTVMPYAELLHHATYGDLQDFRIGERAIFRMHEDEKGDWVWLTYIQDEMNMLNGHREYYFVDEIDVRKQEITFTQAKFDKTFVRETNLILKIDDETKFWKQGEPAKITDIKVGDALRAKTHGLGKGRSRIAWHIFLDDESLQKFQSEQMQVHAQRMTQEGLPGYVDQVEENQLHITLFQEGQALAKNLKKQMTVRVAAAGVDRKPSSEPVIAKVIGVSNKGKLTHVQLSTDAPLTNFQITGLARLWLEP